MLFLRSFLGKIKRWPNLCWVSKKEKKGGEGKRKRKAEKKLLLIGSQHLDEGITVKKGMNLDELFIYWSLKLRGKSNTLLP